MADTRDVAVIVGSLRKGSYSRMAARALARLAPETLRLDEIGIRQLPPYDQDLDDEATPPDEWTAFRQRIRAADAVLFVTPEYNRSMPGVLKNAIDVGSRPFGKSAWSRKPGGVVSVSTGAPGAFGANHHLRQSMVFLDVPMMQQPEVYLGKAAEAFDEAGEPDERTARYLRKFINAYSEWIENFLKG